MKHKRERQRLTLLYIPDVNHPVRKWHYSKPIAWLLSATLICGIVTLIIWQISMHWNASSTISTLQEQLDDEKQRLQAIQSSKDATIQQLQLEILRLAEQAQDIHHQLNQIKSLEEEIRNLSEETNDQLQTASAHNENPYITSHPLAQGGELHNITEQQMQQFIQDTQSRFENLGHEMNLLSTRLEQTKQLLEVRIEEARKIPSIWPTSSRDITSGFGIRQDPFLQTPQFHYGIDISGKANDPIVATADGIIETTGNDSSKGNYIVINHNNGLRTVYMHLSSITVNQGTTVQKGDQIGTMGSTGRSTGVHLHYEVHQNGQEVNPMLYLPN